MPNLFKLTKPHPQIYCFLFPRSDMAADTFAGLSEYYEGGNMSGMELSYRQMKETYSLANDGWTYGEDWAGFNLPGKSVAEYEAMRARAPFVHIGIDGVSKTVGGLMPPVYGPEQVLLNSLREPIAAWREHALPFYVIGCAEKDYVTLRHELAHAFWAIDPAVHFRGQMSTYRGFMRHEVVESLKGLAQRFTDDFTERLISAGYGEAVIEDELHAYTADNEGLWLDQAFDGSDWRWLNKTAVALKYGLSTLTAVMEAEHRAVAFLNATFDQYVEDVELREKLKG